MIYVQMELADFLRSPMETPAYSRVGAVSRTDHYQARQEARVRREALKQNVSIGFSTILAEEEAVFR
ncbi:MAG: hypothetical protein IK016_04945 [Lachnospiraceae bacterium]|nr:hypothetical protein [Lachnospiraceae bacterium]